MTEMDDNWRQSLYGQFFLQEIPNDCRISSTKSCDCCRALSLCILRIFASQPENTFNWKYSTFPTFPAWLKFLRIFNLSDSPFFFGSYLSLYISIHFMAIEFFLKLSSRLWENYVVQRTFRISYVVEVMAFYLSVFIIQGKV